MKKGIMKILIQIMIIFAISLSFGLSMPSITSAQRAKSNEIKYTGEHGRNIRVTEDGGKTELVKGTIYSVRGNTIVMDGESFSLSGAKIHDQLGLPVKVKDLHPGLKVQIVFKNGSAWSVSVENFFRSKVITDPQELERMRQRDKNLQGR